MIPPKRLGSHYTLITPVNSGWKTDSSIWKVPISPWLRGHGLDGMKLIIGDKCMGTLGAVREVSPDAKYHRCTVHFYRNVFSVIPRSKMKTVAKMLKAIHAQESKAACRKGGGNTPAHAAA